MKFAASTPAFDRALSVEIAASEQIRMRVLAGTLAILFLGDQLLFLFARETLEQFAGRLLPTWLPLKVFGPFLAYEILALVVLRYRRGRGKSMPTAARFANAVIETSLPTVILWWMNQFTSPLVAFGAWPTLLYFVFIVASTLRLDFVLPAFTWRVFIPAREGVLAIIRSRHRSRTSVISGVQPSPSTNQNKFSSGGMHQALS
jgi:adenylate cyclase